MPPRIASTVDGRAAALKPSGSGNPAPGSIAPTRRGAPAPASAQLEPALAGQSKPRISSVEEMVHHRLPDWNETLWGKKRDWFHEMRKLAEEADVRLNGARIPVRVTMVIGGDSPFMSAVDIAGINFYEWLLQAPEECHRFLEMITDRYIEVETNYRTVAGRPVQDGMNYSDDSAQMISPELYRKFCVPGQETLPCYWLRAL